jgi:hypothetical protein
MCVGVSVGDLTGCNRPCRAGLSAAVLEDALQEPGRVQVGAAVGPQTLRMEAVGYFSR